MLYVALRNMSPEAGPGPASNSQAGLRADSALAKLQPASRTPSHAKHSGTVRDHADHRCGGSAGLVSRGDSPDFPLIRPANPPALRAGQTARQKPDCDRDDNRNGGGKQGYVALPAVLPHCRRWQEERARCGGQIPRSGQKNAQPRLGVYIGGIKCLVADSSPPSEHLIQWPY